MNVYLRDHKWLVAPVGTDDVRLLSTPLGSLGLGIHTAWEFGLHSRRGRVRCYWEALCVAHACVSVSRPSVGKCSL